jgi:hypothetical protein
MILIKRTDCGIVPDFFVIGTETNNFINLSPCNRNDTGMSFFMNKVGAGNDCTNRSDSYVILN